MARDAGDLWSGVGGFLLGVAASGAVAVVCSLQR